MMVCPPLFEMFIQIYGWRGAMLLLGAFNAHTLVCGVMVRPRPKDKGIAEIVVEKGTHKKKKGVDYGERSNFRHMMDRLTKYLEFLFVDNPKFIAIMMADLLSGVLFTGWAIFLVPHAMARGMSSQLASFLSSSGAVGLIVGRVLMGPLIQGGCVTALQLYVILAVINAGAFFVDVILTDFPVMASLAFVNGLCTGTLGLLSFGASAEILGDDHAVNAYSITLMLFPVADLVGGIVLGK